MTIIRRGVPLNQALAPVAPSLGEVVLGILHRIVQENAVFLEEPMDLLEVFKPEQLLNLMFREPVRTVPFECKCFEQGSGRILARGRKNRTGAIRNFKGDGHRGGSFGSWA